MVKTERAFINYLQIVLSEDSPNRAWATNNIVYVRQAAGIAANESLSINQLIGRLNAITNEQNFIESLLLKTPSENLMAYTADIWAKAFESDTFRVNDLSVSAKRRVRNYVSLHLSDLTDDLGPSDFWSITANAANYQSMIDALPKKSRYKYQDLLDACIKEIAEQIDFERFGGTLEGLQKTLTSDAEAYAIFKTQLKRDGYTTFLTDRAKRNIAIENRTLRENLIYNGVDRASADAYVEIQNEQRDEVLLKVATGQEKEQEPLEDSKNPLKRLTSIVKNTASSIKADPIKFAKTFAHGAVKSAIINAAISQGDMSLTALAVTGVTALYSLNQYRLMQQEAYKTELAKVKYHVNAMTELTVNQFQEFERLCAGSEMKKEIRRKGKDVSLTGELKRQLAIKTAMELGSNILMAIPGGKMVLDGVVGGSKIAFDFLVTTTKNLTSAAIQGVKYYQNQVFQARNRGATESEINDMRASYKRKAFDLASISFLSRETTGALNIAANEVNIGGATFMEKFSDFAKTKVLDKIPFIERIPFLNNIKQNPATVAAIQDQETAKIQTPSIEVVELDDRDNLVQSNDMSNLDLDNVQVTQPMSADLDNELTR